MFKLSIVFEIAVGRARSPKLQTSPFLQIRVIFENVITFPTVGVRAEALHHVFPTSWAALITGHAFSSYFSGETFASPGEIGSKTVPT